MDIHFTPHAWEDYLSWQTEDKRMVKKINELIKAISRDPFSGIGKPEALKHDLGGFGSRRIDREHRIVYKIWEKSLYIISCKYHYD